MTDSVSLDCVCDDNISFVWDGTLYLAISISYKSNSAQLIWALVTANGAGPLFHTGSTLHGRGLSWNNVYGLQSFIGGYGSGFLGQSGIDFLTAIRL